MSAPTVGPAQAWLLEFAWHGLDAGTRAMLQEREADVRLYRSIDGASGCAYLRGRTDRPGPRWIALQRTLTLDGAAAGAGIARAPFHYVVATDVLPGHEADFNAWYDTEHLPGLVAVPGTMRASRYLREGSPRHHACYDLATRDAFGSPAWLAVRATDWSSRVRPTFRHTTRTMYAAVDPARLP